MFLHVLSSSVDPMTDVPSRGRLPRSRKTRPCDRCRRAKTRCTINADGPPCSQCRDTARPCTFELPSVPRPTPASLRSEDPLSDYSTEDPEPSAKRTRYEDQEIGSSQSAPEPRNGFDSLSSDKYEAHGEHYTEGYADLLSLDGGLDG